MKTNPNKTNSSMLIGLRVRYMMAVDLLLIWLAIVLAFMIRYEALFFVWPYLQQNGSYFLFAPLVRLPVYFGFRLYNRMWRYASMGEMKMIVLAGLLSSALIYALNFWLAPVLGLAYLPSRSVWLIEGILSLAFLAGSRLVLRLLQERYRPHELVRLNAFVQNPSRVLIAGAGDSGAVMLREVQNNRSLGLHLVGFVDDDPNKRRLSINGVPVLGDRHAIPDLVKRHKIDQIIIAMPTAPGSALREIVQFCERAGIQPRTVPGLYELLDGTAQLAQVRNVSIEDLLRREPIQTDIGVGIGHFNQVIPLLYPYFLIAPSVDIPHAHNLFLQVGVDLGMPGLVAWLAIVLVLFVIAAGTVRRPAHADAWALAAGVLGGMVALLVHGQVDAALWGTKLAFIPWLLFALAVLAMQRR